MSRPYVLVAGGLDPTGGAGLAADLEALLAVGARALPVATALTIQGPAGALGFDKVPARLVEAQVQGLFTGRGARPSAVKTGMLGSSATARALATLCSRAPLADLPLVMDPVLAASSGLRLFERPHGRSVAHLLKPLLARATVVTPNRLELAALCGLAPTALASDDDAVDAARSLGVRAVLVTGGHRRGAPVDLLVEGRVVRRFEGRRRPGTERGTGCRLASAMAGLLAQGLTLAQAVRRAKRFVESYLDAARDESGSPGSC